MSDLLRPGHGRVEALLSDDTLIAVMVEAELAWLRALASIGRADTDRVAEIETVLRTRMIAPEALAAGTEDYGNPAAELVAVLRAGLPAADAALLHRGLTSQDIIDTALILLSRGVFVRLRTDLDLAIDVLIRLAGEHRATVMAGRTLTQFAVPITFGLKAAQWLSSLVDAAASVDRVRSALPVQCGGASGTLARSGASPVSSAEAFAAELGLGWPGLPWHTNRAPITRIGDALVGCADAMGTIASDVLLLSRPEIGELSEGGPRRGGSSTMPHKRNPVLSVLIRAAALQAPLLGAQLHSAAGQAVDERPDGAWHSEWPALRNLLSVTLTASGQLVEVLGGLNVHAEVMESRVAAAASDLLAESRGEVTTPTDYLGATPDFIDAAIAAARTLRGGH
ncbi:lyase family protein [Gordonia sp. FQ]|uniref:lyase family protein n=1 Tax=Gordonia sp. FQ TaxID=3446634 RepID=UPI003F864140